MPIVYNFTGAMGVTLLLIQIEVQYRKVRSWIVVFFYFIFCACFFFLLFFFWQFFFACPFKTRLVIDLCVCLGVCVCVQIGVHNIFTSRLDLS